MTAPREAVEAVQRALDEHVIDWKIDTTWHCSCRARFRNRGEAMEHRAVAAADAAQPALAAQTLREAVQDAIDMGAVKSGDRVWTEWLRARADRIKAAP